MHRHERLNSHICGPTRGRAHSSCKEAFELYKLDVPARGPVARPVFALAGVAVRASAHIRAYMRQISTIAPGIYPLKHSPAIPEGPMTVSAPFERVTEDRRLGCTCALTWSSCMRCTASCPRARSRPSCTSRSSRRAGRSRPGACSCGAGGGP